MSVTSQTSVSRLVRQSEIWPSRALPSYFDAYPSAAKKFRNSSG
ncbi:uncharacterized protein METZ01_LOCUS377357, partial [marine metagenome]